MEEFIIEKVDSQKVLAAWRPFSLLLLKESLKHKAISLRVIMYFESSVK